MMLRGVVESGRKEAAGFVALDWVSTQIRQKLGFSAFPGTLNLRIRDKASLRGWQRLRKTPGIRLAAPDETSCDAVCFPVQMRGAPLAAVVLPLVPGYPEDALEILSPLRLREHLGLRDGDECTLLVQGAHRGPRGGLAK